jgi:hypothetical protein
MAWLGDLKSETLQVNEIFINWLPKYLTWTHLIQYYSGNGSENTLILTWDLYCFQFIIRRCSNNRYVKNHNDIFSLILFSLKINYIVKWIINDLSRSKCQVINCYTFLLPLHLTVKLNFSDQNIVTMYAI